MLMPSCVRLAVRERQSDCCSALIRTRRLQGVDVALNLLGTGYSTHGFKLMTSTSDQSCIFDQVFVCG